MSGMLMLVLGVPLVITLGLVALVTGAVEDAFLAIRGWLIDLREGAGR